MALLNADGGQRRRRVLTERMIAAPASEPGRAKKTAGADEAGRARSYAEETFAAQPSLVGFIATRYAMLALWLLAASLAVVGLEAAHAHLPELERIAPREQWTAFDLTRRGNLGDWYASLLMLSAAAGSLAIYSIRRHKVDDYSGRYRVWLWAAVGWLALSADAVARLHLTAAALGVSLTGAEGWADGAWWWLTPAAAIYGALGVRLALEVRSCRLACASLTLAFGGWIFALVARLGGLPIEDAALLVVIRSSAGLAGHVLLLLALGLYARHIVLDARGELPRREPKPKREKRPRRERKAAAVEEQAEASADPAQETATEPAKPRRRVKIDPPHAGPPKPKTVEWTDGSNDWEDDDAAQQKLSKAERRRLRKQARQRHEIKGEREA